MEVLTRSHMCFQRDSSSYHTGEDGAIEVRQELQVWKSWWWKQSSLEYKFQSWYLTGMKGRNVSHTPPENERLDSQNHGGEKVTPALNMAMFGINSLDFGGVVSLKCDGNITF